VKIAQTLAGDKFLDLQLPAETQARDLAVRLTVQPGEESGFRNVVTVGVNTGHRSAFITSANSFLLSFNFREEHQP
jgi:hypothetical protein